MSDRLPELPREPYGALATFLIVPLIAASVALTVPRTDTPASPRYVGAALGGATPVRAAVPRAIARRDSAIHAPSR